jgi:hypothetical protein
MQSTWFSVNSGPGAGNVIGAGEQSIGNNKGIKE